MSDEEPLRIWWNKNLHHKISPAKLAAHAAHAALAAYGITYAHPIVVLAAGKGRIDAMPIAIHDAGKTELAPGTTTTGVEDSSHLEWLAGVRREAAEKAWDEGYMRAVRDSVFDMTPADNPYREETERKLRL